MKRNKERHFWLDWHSFTAGKCRVLSPLGKLSKLKSGETSDQVQIGGRFLFSHPPPHHPLFSLESFPYSVVVMPLTKDQASDRLVEEPEEDDHMAGKKKDDSTEVNTEYEEIIRKRKPLLLTALCVASVTVLVAVVAVASLANTQGKDCVGLETLAGNIPLAGWHASPALGAMQEPIPDFRFA